jgi:hypothetical protein
MPAHALCLSVSLFAVPFPLGWVGRGLLLWLAGGQQRTGRVLDKRGGKAVVTTKCKGTSEDKEDNAPFGR